MIIYKYLMLGRRCKCLCTRNIRWRFKIN